VEQFAEDAELVGGLRQLLWERAEWKSTVVPGKEEEGAKFSDYFDGAPIFNVPGRRFPVDVLYTRAPEADYVDAAVVTTLQVHATQPPGDVLVFLPGEREIRDAHAALNRRKYRATEVIPLYARLSARDQDKVFNPGPGRRIVLATTVAETSLTVPRIRYVIDPGTARVKRYSPRGKLDRLHIEPISQASADQRFRAPRRIGRCRMERLGAGELVVGQRDAGDTLVGQRHDDSGVRPVGCVPDADAVARGRQVAVDQEAFEALVGGDHHVGNRAPGRCLQALAFGCRQRVRQRAERRIERAVDRVGHPLLAHLRRHALHDHARLGAALARSLSFSVSSRSSSHASCTLSRSRRSSAKAA
jgi:hypothetical protein